MTETLTSGAGTELVAGEKIWVNTTTEGNQSSPDIAAIGAGNIALVWETVNFTGQSSSTGHMQLMTQTGDMVGNEIILGAGDGTNVWLPEIE